MFSEYTYSIDTGILNEHSEQLWPPRKYSHRKLRSFQS